jgi:hypothetical protein
MRERMFGGKMNKYPEKKPIKFDLERRKFLKGAGIAALTGLVGGELIVKKGLQKIGREIAEAEIEKEKARENLKADQKAEENPHVQTEIKRELPPPPAGHEYVRGQNEKAVQKLLGEFNLEDVNLAGVEKATENYIYFQHIDNPKLATSLENGYVAMQKYVPGLKEIFEKEGVPEEYIYLALSESYWNPSQKSPAGAVGPYQITENTAKLFHMNSKDRTDPIKSAELCAQHLAEIHKKSGSWPVAVCGYDGQYVNQCMGQLWEKNHDHKCSYSQYEMFMEDKINELKRKLRANVWEHKVNDGETVSDIAGKYGLSWQEIARHNQLKYDRQGNPIVRAGEILKIPIQKMETKKLVYESEMAGIIENLKYVARFRAIYARIHDHDFLQKVAERENNRNLKIAREQLNTKY